MLIETWVAARILDKALELAFDRPELRDVRHLLRGDPVQAALARALNAAHADLEATHPQPALDVFTPEFFRQDDVQAELARLLTRHPDEAPDPQRLAELARTQYRPGREPPLEALLPAAAQALVESGQTERALAMTTVLPLLTSCTDHAILGPG